eukprot:1180530-Prorocentrum_minimum.AAC.7
MVQGAVKLEVASGPKPRQIVALFENLGIHEKLEAANSTEKLSLSTMLFDELQVRSVPNPTRFFSLLNEKTTKKCSDDRPRASMCPHPI